MIKITSLPKSLEEVRVGHISVNTPFYCNNIYIKSSSNTAVCLDRTDLKLNTFSPNCLIRLVELEIQVKWKTN